MSQIVVTRCCGAEVRFEPMADVPAPPGSLFATVDNHPEEWKGWVWVCSACGAECGVTYDYGTLDLGLVRDEQLGDRADDFEILG